MRIETPYLYMPTALYYFITFLLFATCILSAWGSITIVYLVVHHRKFRKSTFHRIMFGMASCDLFSSIGLFVAPFAIPKTTHLPLAVGNSVTCQAHTMLLVQSLGSVYYSTALSLYFLLTVKFGKSENCTSKTLEPWIHIVPLFLPLATNCAALLLDSATSYSANPVFGICTDECARDITGFCLPNNTPSAVPVTFPLVVSVFPANLFSIVLTWMVYQTVRQHEAASNVHSIQGFKQTKVAAVRAVAYTCANMNSLVISVLMAISPHIVGDLATLKERPQVSILAVVMLNLYPIQGFLNGVIYCRPAVLRWRKAFPNRSLWWAYHKVLAGKVAPPRAFRKSSRTTHQLSSTQSTITPSILLECPSRGGDINDCLDHKGRLSTVDEEEKTSIGEDD